MCGGHNFLAGGVYLDPERMQQSPRGNLLTYLWAPGKAIKYQTNTYICIYIYILPYVLLYLLVCFFICVYTIEINVVYICIYIARLDVYVHV